MTNLALGKLPVEKWHTPEEATNGKHVDYNANSGYTKAHWPNYFTIDLEAEQSIDTIQFLLYDKDDRNHQYRLLTSCDAKNWTVHYDTSQDGLNGWQSFRFEDKIKARYIRLHALHDSKTKSFHIIEFQIFDDKPDNSNITIMLDKLFLKNDSLKKVIEIGDGTTISNKINGLIKTIEKLSNKYKDVFNTKYLSQAKSEIESRVVDIARIEKEASAIRREILNPISSRIRTSNILQYVSIVFGLIGILSFILQMTGCI